MARLHSIKRFVNSFTGRIVLGEALIHILLIPLLFAGVLFLVKDGYQTQFINQARSDTHLFATVISHDLDPERVQMVLDDAILSGRLVFAEVDIEPDMVIRSANIDDKDFIEDFFYDQHHDTIYYIAVPLESNNFNTIATLRVGYDEEPTNLQIQTTYRRGLYLAIGYVFISMLLALFIGPELTRPLRRLRDGAQQIASGLSSKGLNVSTSISEIVSLTEDLESMREELVSRSQAIEAREARIRAVMNNVVDGIITIDAQGQIESVNPAASRIFGYPTERMIGISFDELLAQPYFCKFENNANSHAHNGSPRFSDVEPHESAGRHRDGSSFPIEMAISEIYLENRSLFIAIVRDISQRKEAEAELRALQEDLERRVISRTKELAAVNAELEHQALHDALTDLPNRTLLLDRLNQAILIAQREGHLLSLFIMDLDHFKEINDTLGHHYGDLLLEQVAKRLKNAMRESDTIARLGGDEFAVLLPTVDSVEHASLTAHKAIDAMTDPFILEGQSFHIGLSVGAAMFPEHGVDAGTLMRRADVAMYVAKRTNGGYSLYHAEKDWSRVNRLAMIEALHHAVEYKQLVLCYQPKIDLQTGCLCGVEALVHWEHPEQGLLRADHFIPLAEQTGLIKPLTIYVLDEALHQLHLWQHGGLNLRMAVNLSVHNLQDEELANYIPKLMDTWNIGPEWLELEITESAIMADPRRAMDILNRLNNMGVRLSIDDFGTGYSSLAHLRQLPVDEIKIDKSFVINMLENEEDTIIVRSIIDLAHNMGRTVIAEGVESQKIWDKLVQLGCDMAQGYYMSRPLMATAFRRWLKDSPWGLKCMVPLSRQEKAKASEH